MIHHQPAAQPCACCLPPGFRPGLGRRGLFGLAAGLAAAALPRGARAADGTAYDCMLLTCIDPRLVSPVNAWMESEGLRGKFSQFAIAGASVGVVAPSFAGWAPAFWDNLGASIQLHKISRVMVVNHRDCGAAKIAYGEAAIATREAETELHRRVFAEFAAQLAQKQPALKLAGGLMGLDGAIDKFA
jgi:carbonic anhydrase